MKEIKIDANYDKHCGDVCITLQGVTFNHNNLFDLNTLMLFIPKDKADELSFKIGSAIQDMERTYDPDSPEHERV